MTVSYGPICQTAWVTEDIEATEHLLSRQFGGPMDYPTEVIYINHDERYRGRGDYIDGEVIEVIDSSPVAAQRHAG